MSFSSWNVKGIYFHRETVKGSFLSSWIVIQYPPCTPPYLAAQKCYADLYEYPMLEPGSVFDNGDIDDYNQTNTLLKISCLYSILNEILHIILDSYINIYDKITCNIHM